MEVARLDTFLDEGGIRIPRAHLDGANNAAFDALSTASSGYTIEEIERRVTTDVTTKEIKTTTVTDSSGNVITTKAETHIFPGDTTVTTTTTRGGSSALATEASSSAYESTYGARSHLRESGETYASTGAHLNEAYSSSAGYASSGAAVLRVCLMLGIETNL